MKRVEVVWPEDLVEQIDQARGQHSRSSWLRRLAEGGLAGNMQDSIKAGATWDATWDAQVAETPESAERRKKAFMKELKANSSPPVSARERSLKAKDLVERTKARHAAESELYERLAEGPKSARERLAARTAQMRGNGRDNK